ncbi:unnamed protein product [Prunus armeniaca]|uniref:Potassium transporter n=1 Tax=Prunus armeniaca TaxID=36596 RepID=A0A6J5UNL0_PRUAR|nr:unnamed protein product [Prunus armeniaca]
MAASVHLCHPCGMLDGYLKSSGLNPPWEYHLQPSKKATEGSSGFLFIFGVPLRCFALGSVSFQYRGRPRKRNWGIEKTWRGSVWVLDQPMDEEAKRLRNMYTEKDQLSSLSLVADFLAEIFDINASAACISKPWYGVWRFRHISFMADIVTEQWIQIQRLKQALHITQVCFFCLKLASVLSAVGGINVGHSKISNEVVVLVAVVILRGGKGGWTSLGGIMLSITGTEALFADLSHFPVSFIQIAFTLVVFPCLLLAYCGQAAYLVKNSNNVIGAFYHSIPDNIYWPVFIVATAVAVVASQATITATFSLIKQALALGCFPRVKVLGFKNQNQIGNASVVTVPPEQDTLVSLKDYRGTYFSAVLLKVNQGGWVPLVITTAFFIIMYVWHYGTVKWFEIEMHSKVSMAWILGLGPSLGLVRVPGIGLVYTELASGVPRIFSHFITNLPAIHSVVVFVCVKYLPVWTVPEEERLLDQQTKQSGDGLFCNSRNLLHSNVNRSIASGDSIVPDDSPLHANNITSSIPASNQVGTDDEVEFLNNCRDAGVVHILGNTVIEARRESKFWKKIAIDYLYAFPLYVFYNTFPDGIGDPEDLVGALSVIIYSLTLIPLLKYVFIVCRENDNGQGGTFALYSLLCRHAKIKAIPNQDQTDEALTTYSRSTFGTEALFADLSHFPVPSIQIAFTSVVFPCLLLAYCGQAAYLMKNSNNVIGAFYHSIPDSIYWPVFIVATAAAIVASQATITATFSLIKQALALGCFPRVQVVHTSRKYRHQIYIPEINWIVMILCIAVTAGDGSLYSNVGNHIAYDFSHDISVALPLDSCPDFHWLIIGCGGPLTFLRASLKVNQGGWVPLVIAAAFFVIMYIWHYGTVKRFEIEMHSKVSMAWILGLVPV